MVDAIRLRARDTAGTESASDLPTYGIPDDWDTERGPPVKTNGFKAAVALGCGGWVPSRTSRSFTSLSYPIYSCALGKGCIA